MTQRINTELIEMAKLVSFYWLPDYRLFEIKFFTIENFFCAAFPL